MGATAPDAVSPNQRLEEAGQGWCQEDWRRNLSIWIQVCSVPGGAPTPWAGPHGKAERQTVKRPRPLCAVPGQGAGRWAVPALKGDPVSAHAGGPLGVGGFGG